MATTRPAIPGSRAAGAPASPLLRVNDLRVRIGSVAAISGVSFDVARGDFFGVVGESGSGKSVTARAILGLLPEHAEVSGSVQLDSEEVIGASAHRLRRIRGGKVGFVFQDALAALDPVYTVGDQLVEALQAHRTVSRTTARAQATELLDEVRIPRPAEHLDRYPHQLSGGMRQRVVIASALIADPDLIIADEPTTALDVTVQRQVLDLLGDICARRGASVLLITHDLGVIAQTCDRVAVFYGGLIVEEASTVALFEDPLHPYTAALVRSLPRIGVDAPFEAIPGIPAQIKGRLGQCPFAPRCALAIDSCRSGVPAELSIGDRRHRCLRAGEASS